MSSELLSQGGFGCVYFPALNCMGESTDNKKTVSKVQKKSFSSQNEIEIGKIIRKFQNWNLFFIPVEDSCSVKITNIDDSLLKDCDVISDSEKKYSITQIPFVKNITFESLFVESFNNKERFISVLNIYDYLLHSIKILIELNICHFDLKLDNILINQITRSPLIIDFGISIPINKINSKNINKYFYAFAPEYYLWSPEIHLINFLLNEIPGQEYLTKDNCLNLSNLVIDSNKALVIYSPNFIEKMKNACFKFYSKYIGISKNEIISNLLEYYSTWDNYALSILFLKV